MEQEDLQVFINEVIAYFYQVTGVDAQVDAPYKKGSKIILLDYTGHIGISGERRGSLYITCSKDMLKDLTSIIMEGEDVEDDTLIDMIGEIANTIAGNVRITFGKNFTISVPSIFSGQPQDFRIILKTPVLVIPINWKKHTSFVVIGID